MKLRNVLTGEYVAVRATTDHPQSSYGKAVWVDSDNDAHCQEGLESLSGYELVEEKAELGNLLRSIREEKGLNKNHFIKNGMRIETLNAIEEGSKNYTVESLLFYLRILEVDLKCIFASVENKNTNLKIRNMKTKDEIVSFVRSELEDGNTLVIATIGNGGAGLELMSTQDANKINSFVNELSGYLFDGAVQPCDDITSHASYDAGCEVYQFSEKNGYKIQIMTF